VRCARRQVPALEFGTVPSAPSGGSRRARAASRKHSVREQTGCYLRHTIRGQSGKRLLYLRLVRSARWGRRCLRRRSAFMTPPRYPQLRKSG